MLWYLDSGNICISNNAFHLFSWTLYAVLDALVAQSLDAIMMVMRLSITVLRRELRHKMGSYHHLKMLRESMEALVTAMVWRESLKRRKRMQSFLLDQKLDATKWNEDLHLSLISHQETFKLKDWRVLLCVYSRVNLQKKLLLLRLDVVLSSTFGKPSNSIAVFSISPFSILYAPWGFGVLGFWGFGCCL